MVHPLGFEPKPGEVVCPALGRWPVLAVRVGKFPPARLNGLFRQRGPDLQDAVGVGSFDAFFLDPFGQRDAAGKGAVAELGPETVLVFVLFLLLTFGTNVQRTPRREATATRKEP